MLKKTGLLILTVLLAILLTGGFNPGQKVIAANPQEERETCTVKKKSAKLRNGKTGKVITTLAKGTKVFVLGGGFQGWYQVRVKRGKKTITGDLNLVDMKFASNPDTQ